MARTNAETEELLAYVEKARRERDLVSLEMIRFKTEKLVSRLLRKRVSSPGDVEILLEEVYLAAWRSLLAGRFDRTKGTSVHAWLLGIARNIVHHYWRSRPSTVSMCEVADLGEDRIAPRLRDTWEGSLRKTVCGILDGMPNPRRSRALALMYVDGKSYKQVAKAMHLANLQAARQLMYYARLEFVRVLRDKGLDESLLKAPRQWQDVRRADAIGSSARLGPKS